MKYIIALLTTIAIIVACRNSDSKNSLTATPDTYEGKQYTVQVDRDTTLMTANGALLKIPKGALSVDKGNTATLEIKEAYTIDQMIKAGLYTRSNGEILSSGGMIYINAADGNNVKINQPINVAIPANYLNNKMQLYKGEKDAKGNINWTNPVTLPENPQQKALDNGQVMFQAKCASCHAIDKDLTAPSLAHILRRFDLETSGNYLLHYGQMRKIDFEEGRQITPQDYFREHNEDLFTYKCNLSSRFGGLTGPDFVEEVRKDSSMEAGGMTYLLNIYNYIQRESDRLALPLPWQAGLKECADSCKIYKETVKKIKEFKSMSETKKQRLIEENGPLVIQDNTPVNLTNTNPTPPNFEELVSPENYQAVYYQFNIESFGWYNVDMLLKEGNGNVESELLVSIAGDYQDNVKLYLIIPSIKVCTPGGFTSDTRKEYAFAEKSGKIFLPQNTDAYILAMSETGDGIAYGLTHFITTQKQKIVVTLKDATKEEFETAISSLNLKDFKVTVDETKNANEIRKIVTEIKTSEEQMKKAELLKPKGCDCDCRASSDSTKILAGTTEFIAPDSISY